jgi:hypothetical protein
MNGNRIDRQTSEVKAGRANVLRELRSIWVGKRNDGCLRERDNPLFIQTFKCSNTINVSGPQLRFPSLSMSLPISEHPRHSPTRSLSFYLVLVFCVLPVWSIPIFSWSFVLYELRGGGISGLSWHGRALFTYALAEARRPTTQSLPSSESTSLL